MHQSEVIKMLSNLQTGELSLVRRGANRKRYAITKAETPTMKLNIASIVNTPAEGEDKLLATLKSAGADEERIATSLAHYRLLKGTSDVVKSDDIEAVLKGADCMPKKSKKNEQDDEGGEGEGGQDEGEGGAPTKKKRTKKSAELDLSNLSDADREGVEAVLKSHESLEEKTKNLEAVVKSLNSSVATLTESVANKAITESAKRFVIPGMSTDQVAAVLKSADKIGPEARKALETSLGAMTEVVQKSDLFQQIGAAGEAGPEQSAMQKLEEMRDSLVQKGDGKLTPEKAYAIVLKSAEGKKLYAQYLKQNPKQGG